MDQRPDNHKDAPAKVQQQPKKLAQLLDRIESIADTDLRFALLIDYADRFTEVPERIAKRPFPKEHQVPFCESEGYVWLEVLADGTANLHFAVENPSGISAKALAEILTETLSGSTPDEIAKVTPEIVYRLFGPSISMGKGQGLTAMVTMVKLAAQRLSGSQTTEEL